MFKRRSLFLSLLVLASLAAGTVLMAAPPASAAEGSCGSGYKRILNAKMLSASGKNTPGNESRTQILVNEKTKKFCALVQRNGDANGVAGKTSVVITLKGGKQVSDKGTYKYYAGPKTLPNTTCISITGRLTYKGIEYSYQKAGLFCDGGKAAAAKVKVEPSPIISSPSGSKYSTPVKGVRARNSWGELGYGRTVPHQGIDFSTNKCGKADVRAVADGTAKVISGRGWAGNHFVSIDHGRYTTLYAHMGSDTIKNGQKVKAGQKIGTVGKQGKATGCHLHFEVLDGSKHINPYTWMKNHGLKSALR